jgi:hypothetical protein
MTSCIGRENSSRAGIGRSVCIVVAAGADLAARLSCHAWRVVSALACAPAAGTPAQPQQHDHGSQPGLVVAVSRALRRLVRVLHQLGIPARASRLAARRELVRNAPPAVLADAVGVSPGTAMRHAFLSDADWSAYAARRRAHTPDDKTS